MNGLTSSWLIFFSWKRVLNTSRNRTLSFFLEIVSAACLEFGERCDEDGNSERLKKRRFLRTTISQEPEVVSR